MANKSEYIKEWRKNTKLKVLACMGKKCQICGYDKCTNALELHHIDPNEKDFGLGAIMATPVAWEKIVTEMKKCVVLCANCHRELHDNLVNLPTTYQMFDESLLQKEDNVYLLKQTKTTHCPTCNKIKDNRNTYCSLSCASTGKGKVNWDSVDLIDLIENQKLTKTSIAQQMNCSDQAVNKRYKKLKAALVIKE